MVELPWFVFMEAELKTKVVEHDTTTSAPAPENRRETPSSGTSIGRYQLVRRLGHGGMATVFLARAEGKAGFEKLVAVKVIHPHLASEPEFVDMFLDEARIAARIHHPHVVEILDLGEHDGLYFMVLEYVEGETLSTLVRALRKHDERLPVAVVLQIMADACEGLAAAHALEDAAGRPLGLVHRDVSPQNLLVGLDGWVKVMDFGIMKAAGKRSNTLTGQLRGKLPYMSPEQASGQPLDHRTDLFALGAVFWELLTNERLFDAPTEALTLEKVNLCEVPDLRTRRSEVPAGVTEILHRALAADRNNRYDSASEMLADLRAVARRLSSDGDPRRQLSQTMRSYFGKKAKYARAAARGSASGAASVVALRASDDDSGSSPTNSQVVPSQVTFTTQLASAPARHWSLWVLLPLLGAAVGTAVVTWNDRQAESVEAAAVSPPQSASQRTQAEPIDAPTQPRQIKWLFNTDPQGATVYLDGEQQLGVTPLELTIAEGDQTREVVLELAGHESRALQLAPVKSDNYNFRLRKVVGDDASPGRAMVAPVKLRKAGPPTPKNSAPEGEGSSERKLDPMPDFNNLAGGGTAHGG